MKIRFQLSVIAGPKQSLHYRTNAYCSTYSSIHKRVHTHTQQKVKGGHIFIAPENQSVF